MRCSRHRSRRGGAVATFIGIFILLMVALAFARAVPGMLSGLARDFIGQDRGDCGTGGAAGVDAASKATVLSELYKSSFWAMVRASAENTTQHLVHDSVVGYMDKDQEWRNWSLRYVPGAAKWADTGFGPYIDAQVTLLQARALASGNVTEAFGVLEDQVSRASGVVLAGVDFVFFNSATGLRAYLETRNATQALCTTYASQLQQLWDQAFNPNITEQERACYLGQALAISTVTVALAGADGVSSNFKAALDKVGLAESWDTIKPYLGKIGSTVSAKASYLTFTLLGKLAQRFPGRPTWEAGFVSDRVDAMAEVLHEKGLSNGAIEQRNQNIVQAADDGASPDSVADKADSISYDDGGGIRMKVDDQNRLWLYTNANTMQYMKASFLEGEVPGFLEGVPISLKVHYWEKGVTVFHHYEGGQYWMGTVPGNVAKAGEEVTLAIEVLTRTDFVKSLPRLTLGNEFGMRWMSNTVDLKSFTLNADDLKIGVAQDPPVAGISDFVIDGSSAATLGFRSGDTTLDLGITDAFGRMRFLRIYFDGYGPLSLGISKGTRFAPISFLAFDGTRLSLPYTPSEGTTQVATIYLADPSLLYKLGDLHDYYLPYQVNGYSQSFKIDSVLLVRELENTMAFHGSQSDVGRIGAEIAYSVGTEKLGLKGLVMNEPALPGTDLFTMDGKVVMQARMLTRTADETGLKLQGDLQGELTDLVASLRNDFNNVKSAKVGYAILTYADSQNTIQTIVLEVLKT